MPKYKGALHATYLEFEINRKANTADPMRLIDFESDV